MTDIKKEQKVNFQLKGIEILDIKLNHPIKPLPGKTIFNFNINIEHKINLDKKLVYVITIVDIIHEDKKTRLASLKTSCIFEITNIKDFFIEEKKQVAFPDHLIISLNSVSISSTRGIMFSQFRGTFLHHAYLPLVDPKKNLKKNKNKKLD